MDSLLTLPPLDDLIETAPLGFCLVDAGDGRVILNNPAFEAMLGAKSRLLGAYLSSVLGEEAMAPIYNRAPSFEYEFAIAPGPNMPQRFLQLRGDRLVEHGQAMYTLWLLDVSTQHHSEDSLKKAIESTTRMAEMRTNLLATMSHEMRTPMQAVYGFLELIAQENLPMHVQEMIANAKLAGSGLLEILDDVLDLTKLEADKMELEKFDVALKPFIQSILDALAVRKSGKPIELFERVEGDVPAYIKADPKRLRQILMNLAGNSLKFTKEGNVSIRVTTQAQRIAAKPMVLRFEVIDTGIGMSEEAQGRLFQPFMQADTSTTRKFGGTGLGLSICKKLVERMGGVIGVTSVEGKGSTFYFEIPVEAVDATEAEKDLPSLDGIAVLVIEDVPEVKNDMMATLKSMGADVEHADTFAEALGVLHNRPYDVAVVDETKQEAGAVEVMKVISEIRPNTGLILHTVRDDHALQHTLRSFGATLLQKPASRKALGEAVAASAKVGGAKDVLAGGKRILIAEDTQIVRDIIGKQLKSLNADLPVDFAENGKIAWDMLHTGNYGILISDLHMPEMDGYMLVKAVRKEEAEQGKPRMPVIVLTADVQMGSRQVYMREGFDACLLKPVTLAQLARLLSRWELADATALPHDKPPPAPAPAPKPMGVVPAAPAPAKHSKIAWGNKRILVAEDVEIAREAFAKQLDRVLPGLPVDFAEDGRKAYKKLKENSYSMLISDIHMPEMNGYMLVQAVRKDEKETGGDKGLPVVAMTADQQLSDPRNFQREGFDDSLIKPVTINKLIGFFQMWGYLDAMGEPKGVETVAAGAPVAGTVAPPSPPPVTAPPAGALPPAVDVNAIGEQMGAVDADTVGMVAMFPAMCLPLFQKMKGALASGSQKDLREAAHSLKGAARSACCMVLGDLACQLQEESEKRPVSENRQLVVAILQEFARVQSAIAKLKEQYGVA